KQLDCTALAALYGDQPEPFAVTHAAATARVLAEQLGELSLKGYQSVAEKALAALTPEERADDERVDALYRDLSFTAKAVPVPAVFPAYAAMYAKHYSYAAACSTLTYAPWAVFHPEITDVYRQLWSAWKDQRPDNAGASLEKSCRLPLLNPSGLYAPQTALR